MEKNYTITYDYKEIRVVCKEEAIKGIARAIALGENADFCYVEDEDGNRITICDCM